MGVGHADGGAAARGGRRAVGLQQQNQRHVVPVQEGVAGAEKLDGIGREQRETCGLEDNRAAVWFAARSLLVLTLVT